MKQRQIIQKSTNKNVLPKIPRDIRKWLHQQATKVYSICYAAKITGTGKTDQEFRIVCHRGIQQKSQLGFAYEYSVQRKYPQRECISKYKFTGRY